MGGVGCPLTIQLPRHHIKKLLPLVGWAFRFSILTDKLWRDMLDPFIAILHSRDPGFSRWLTLPLVAISVCPWTGLVARGLPSRPVHPITLQQGLFSVVRHYFPSDNNHHREVHLIKLLLVTAHGGHLYHIMLAVRVVACACWQLFERRIAKLIRTALTERAYWS